MAYTIAVQIYQTNTDAFFRIAEKTTYPGCSWEQVEGVEKLSIKGSGTSGSLRFVADTGENFVLTLGVHNYKPWGDIVTKVPKGQTAASLNLEYYETEYQGTNNPERVGIRWKTLDWYEVERDGRKYEFKYIVTDGHHLKVDLIIG